MHRSCYGRSIRYRLFDAETAHCTATEREHQYSKCCIARKNGTSNPGSIVSIVASGSGGQRKFLICLCILLMCRLWLLTVNML
ncbi:hypothetical protein BMEI1516 [Brucella melitensis bv. 1 str. 16M]|uniref:Uncharacterized protein n=1 Tax=Brucella melitensis biotype 1 (strain ATCC 23456 / CCUG 17765 / NCTC 10094 / 16M) TaxID=224914 RepID=Q8YFK4_BRUME|nr:hypothetical protein BMEI1516 [Brucella melitensis bv. 1 str. 16M]